MSDIPENYFVNGVELLGFRREINLAFPGEVVKKKKRNGKHKSAPHKSDLNKRDGNLCHYCKIEMKANGMNNPMAMSVEHIVPRSMGGKDKMFNLVLAHRKCNEQRGSEYLKCFCPICENAREIFKNDVS